MHTLTITHLRVNRTWIYSFFEVPHIRDFLSMSKLLGNCLETVAFERRLYILNLARLLV